MTLKTPLTIRTPNEGASNSFVIPTMVTNHHECHEKQNTVAFKPRMMTNDKYWEPTADETGK